MFPIAELIELVYPRYCVCCQSAVRAPGKYICWECSRRLEFHATRGFCRICGKSFESLPDGGFVCSDCVKKIPHFDKARSAVHYHDPVKRMLINLKYNSAVYLKTDLAYLLEACVTTHYKDERIAMICPVPVHPRRFRERGYNQAAELASIVSSRLKIPFAPNALLRMKYTTSQTKLDAAERKANTKGAFSINPLLSNTLYGKTVLVIDDVMTTGATLDTAAATLKQSGAKRVIAATVARD